MDKQRRNHNFQVNNQMIFKKQLLYIKTEPKHDNTAPSFEFSRELVKYGWTPKW